ncbi:hypothetical protein MMC29_001301 [Sticta canariensis]|nr:hypothetical protein [Sticta canariensis]
MAQAKFSEETATFQSNIGHDDKSVYNMEDGDCGSDLDGDFNVDEDCARAEPIITYSTTLGNHRAALEDGRYKDTYTARCGTRVPAVFHDQIRAELIVIAEEGGAYTHSPINGTDATDITAFHPDHRDWQEKGADRPELLKSFVKPQNFTNPDYNVGFMYFDGFLVIDHEGQPLKPFLSIPLTLSSKLEGWRAEAIRRSDPRIRNMDLAARMPVKVEPSANGEPTREPSVKLNALAGRQNRFREQAGAITWATATARSVYDFLWSLLPPDCRDNNLALPRDLTSQERWQLRALNVGKKPERARKIPDADKRMTGDEYIDGVLKKAAGIQEPKGGNTRRLHKKAVRNARREATAETQPDASSIQDELETLPHDPMSLDEMESIQEDTVLPDIASPVSDPAHVVQPAPAAPAALAAPTAIAAPLAFAPHPPARIMPTTWAVDPPFPFVRPGEYLWDEGRKFF